LGYFKYSNFFIENINLFTSLNIQPLDLTLPLAISFFTFQQISYLVDSYRAETKEYSFLNYLLFVTFFPQLIAGPIVHHKKMMPQFALKRNLVKNYTNIGLGIFIFSIGLFKKVVIADTFAVWTIAGFDNARTLNFFESWFTSLSYTFQIYFDFSGYTDMAIGIALLFNIKLPINFNSPYKATSIQDFWRRWHITLSRFLKDYIYIPLGGNREGEFRTYANLMTTFIIGGIWHGASWLFVFWGFLHGLALVVHRVWNRFGFKLWSWLAWFITFNFINITWIFFRAKSWDDALKVLNGMFTPNIVLPDMLADKFLFLEEYGVKFGSCMGNIDKSGAYLMFWMVSGLIWIFIFKNSNEQLKNFKFNFKTFLISILAFLWAILSFNKISEFLYFNF
jgi:D-alanyl-lipoteichoic acid acyltransferase DltB (MBOAT superfamily)